MKYFESVYACLSNQTTNWLRMDTENLYKKHLSEKYEDLEKYGWIDNHFTYKFNSHGFRCEEFSDKPTLMALGCSYTVGIGLPVETIWPELVAKKLNLNCANLGQGGHGPDSAFRLCNHYLTIINPKIVIYMEPPPGRFEFFDGVHDDIPRIYNAARHEDIKFYSDWICADINNKLHYEKNKLAIECLCTKQNIKFISITPNEFDKLYGLNVNIKYQNSLARDLAHPGTTYHDKLSEILLGLI